MIFNENRVRRIIREEALRLMREDYKGTSIEELGGDKLSGIEKFGGDKLANIEKFGGDKIADLEKLGAEVGEIGGGSTEALAGGEAAAAAGGAAAVLGAALLGLAVGTLINKGLNKAGVNDAVINWILAQRVSKVGYDFEVRVDQSVLAGNLDKATGKLTAAGAAGSLRPMSFTITGVQGTLIDPNTMKVINNKSFHGFTGAGQIPVNGVAKVRMPKKPEGIFVPAQLIGQVTYEGGAVVNLISREGSLITVPGTSMIKGTLISNKKLGT